MEKRYAKVIFGRQSLQYCNIGKEELIALIEQLPDDAGLVGMSEDLNRMSCGLVFQSNSFKVSKEAQELPNIIAIFKSNPLSVTLDMNEALDEASKNLFGLKTTEYKSWQSDSNKLFNLTHLQKQVQKNLDKMINNTIIYGSGSMKLDYVDEYNNWKQKYSSTPIYNNEKLNKIDSFSVDSILTLPGLDIYSSSEIKETCSHEWLNYEGFTAKYEYCKKCDVKRA